MICKYCGENFDGGEYCSNCGKKNQIDDSDINYFMKTPAQSYSSVKNSEYDGIFAQPAKKAEEKLRNSAVFS